MLKFQKKKNVTVPRLVNLFLVWDRRGKLWVLLLFFVFFK